MNCELCGKNSGQVIIETEGTTMNVCKDCSRFGKVRGASHIKYVAKQKSPEVQEPEFIFVSGFGSILKKAREKAGLTQEEFAKKLNERESTLHQIESEHFKPSIALAHKLERMLHIKIVEEIKSEESNSATVANKKENDQRRPRGPLTIGDIISSKLK